MNYVSGKIAYEPIRTKKIGAGDDPKVVQSKANRRSTSGKKPSNSQPAAGTMADTFARLKR